MTGRRRVGAGVWLGLMLVLAHAPLPALRGQARPAAGAATTSRSARAATLRTPWGTPDLQGRWTNATLTPLERPTDLAGKEFFTPDEAREYAKTALQRYLSQNGLTPEETLSGEYSPDVWGDPRTLVPTGRTSLIVGPTGRLPPLTPAAQQRAAARAAERKADRADSPEERPLMERCLWSPTAGPPMLPSITYNSNYEIVQTPTHVLIHIEMGNSTRIIPLDGRPHLPPRVTSWFGDSRGHWEGDTLVVETTNFNRQRDFRGSSEQLHLVERFTRTSASQLLYRIEVEDPTVWTAPWQAEIPLQPLAGLIYEYGCHEGNYSIVNILKAARAADAAAASAR